MGARHPRGAALLDGVSVAFVRFEVDANAFHEADKAQVTLAAKGLPQGMDLAAITAATTLELELKAGFPADPEHFTAAELDTLFIGQVDIVRYDPAYCELDLQARDFTARLIDAKTSERFTNITASRLARDLAEKHGLNPVVTDTQTRIGSFYQRDHVRIQQRRSEWDLLTWAASEEDYAVYVRGRDLVFGPRPSPDDKPYILEWKAQDQAGPASFTQKAVSCERMLTLSRDIRVTVRSWNHRRGERIVKRAGPGDDRAQQYEYSIPGLTPDQAQARADQIYRELTEHAMRVSFEGPADNVLALDRVILLKGCAGFDQVYFPESIRRSFSAEEGYRWTVDAKNEAREPQ